MKLDIQNIFSLLGKQKLLATDDRAHIIICTSAIELVLRQRLENRLVDGLWRDSMSLSEMSNLARAVGLMGPNETKITQIVGRIRNLLAHRLEVQSYNNVRVQELLNELKRAIPVLAELIENQRSREELQQALETVPEDLRAIFQRRAEPSRSIIEMTTFILAESLLFGNHNIERIPERHDRKIGKIQGTEFADDGTAHPIYSLHTTEHDQNNDA